VRLASDARGGAVIETLVALPLTLFVFLTSVQLGVLEIASLGASHAAQTSARAASVVLADDPRDYDGPAGHATPRRVDDVRTAGRAAFGFIDSRSDLDVTLDRASYRRGDPVKVRARVTVECRVPFARLVCLVGGDGTRRVLEREATAPYQGAGFEYD
jgi:hypothetical protein